MMKPIFIDFWISASAAFCKGKQDKGFKKQVMPDLGRSTRESGEARLASWRVSPSNVTLV